MIHWVDGWFSRSMGGVRPITKYRINLYLIEIIQFCLNKSWPNQDNSILFEDL